MGKLTPLRPIEAVRLERARLDEIYDSVGESQAEEIICRAMEELATRLAAMDQAYQSGDWSLLGKGARALAAIAGQMGMTTMSRVASDVRLCAERGDAAALGAVLARLMRTSERSLTAVWGNPAGLSG